MGERGPVSAAPESPGYRDCTSFSVLSLANWLMACGGVCRATCSAAWPFVMTPGQAHRGAVQFVVTAIGRRQTRLLKKLAEFSGQCKLVLIPISSPAVMDR